MLKLRETSRWRQKWLDGKKCVIEKIDGAAKGIGPIAKGAKGLDKMETGLLLANYCGWRGGN